VTTILLARHGETTWNRERRFQGHGDSPLTDEGRAQARALADELDGTPLAAVYSSDLPRAVATAEIVAERLGLPVVHVDPDLREIDVGEWSGLTWAEIEDRFPEGVELHRTRGYGWEQGESDDAMAGRVLAALRRIASDRDGEQVLVVVHGGGMRAVAAHIDGVDLVEHRRRHSDPARNCEVRVVVVEDGRLRRLD
jgi:2,3-bisphosphoglycerate-dependent phosphoglycerate mutase